MTSIRNRTPFAGRILMLGCGSVGRCTLPLVLRHIDMPADRITVMDFENVRPRIEEALKAGVVFKQARLTNDNYRTMLAELVSPGDIIVDLPGTWRRTTCSNGAATTTCATSTPPSKSGIPTATWRNKSPYERSLYSRQMRIRQLKSRLKSRGRPSPTAVMDHGANPGLVSHFTKRALIEIASAMLERKRPAATGVDQASFETLVAEAEREGEGLFARLSRATGTKVIHISERGTAGVGAAEGDSTVSSTPGRLKVSTRKAWRRRSSGGAPTSVVFRSTRTHRLAGPGTRFSSPSQAPARSCTRGSLWVGRLSGWWYDMPSPSRSATT